MGGIVTRIVTPGVGGRRVRLVQAVVVVAAAAVVVAAGWASLRPGPAATPPESHASGAVVLDSLTTSTTLGLRGRSYDPGDCVVWDEHGADPAERRTVVVPCEEPHLAEITGRLDVRGRFSRYPTEAEWSALWAPGTGDCFLYAERHLGKPLDPFGALAASALRPRPETWAVGDREVWCHIQKPSDSAPGTLAEYRRRAVDVDQDRLYGTGTCLRTVAERATAAVACDEPHHAEVAGTVDLTTRARNYPADWGRVIGGSCGAEARAYLGRRLPAGVSAGWLEIEADSWKAGRRIVECTVGRYDGGAEVAVAGPRLGL